MTEDNYPGAAFKLPPPPVGYWEMPCGNVSWATTSKPRWLTRFLMKHLMQWGWRDA